MHKINLQPHCDICDFDRESVKAYLCFSMGKEVAKAIQTGHYLGPSGLTEETKRFHNISTHWRWLCDDCVKKATRKSNRILLYIALLLLVPAFFIFAGSGWSFSGMSTFLKVLVCAELGIAALLALLFLCGIFSYIHLCRHMDDEDVLTRAGDQVCVDLTRKDYNSQAEKDTLAFLTRQDIARARRNK